MEKKRLKIAFLSRYQGVVDRGVETYVSELSKRLSKNHEIIVLSGKDADNIRKIINGKFNIVIACNGRFQSLKASMGRLIARYKLIISGQSGPGIDDIFNLLTLPDIFVALTDFAATGAGKLRSAKTWSWGTRVVVIPNGVDLGKFKPQGEKMNIDLSPPIVLTVGALYWYKHHEKTIKAMARTESSLLIVGAGPELENLRELAEKEIPSRFKIISAKFEDLPKIYRAADLFVLPSWDREAFGLVYVEAMASGLSVVAPDDSPRKEIMAQAGILTDVNDPEKYARAIEEALSKDWGNLPRKQAEKFSWDIIADEYEKLFEELA